MLVVSQDERFSVECEATMECDATIECDADSKAEMFVAEEWGLAPTCEKNILACSVSGKWHRLLNLVQIILLSGSKYLSLALSHSLCLSLCLSFSFSLSLSLSLSLYLSISLSLSF